MGLRADTLRSQITPSSNHAGLRSERSDGKRQREGREMCEVGWLGMFPDTRFLLLIGHFLSGP